MQFYVDTTKENFINIRKKHTFARSRLSYDEDLYFLVQQISDRYLRSNHRFPLLMASKTYPSRYDVNPSWADTVQPATEPICWAMGRPEFYTFYLRTNKRPTVLALLATTCEQVAVSPETAMGCRRIRFLQAKRGITVTQPLITLLINNYKALPFIHIQLRR